MLSSTRVKVETPECTPARAHDTDAGLDLVAKETTVLLQGKRVLVKTGVYAAIPIGFAGLLVPRSSLSKNNITMTNSIGIIDSSYRGEIMASLMYSGPTKLFTINKYERIVQLVIVPCSLGGITIVDELDDTARGFGGFGSTG